MELNLKRRYNDLVVELGGEIDSATTGYLREQIESAYRRSHAQNLIFDFRKVSFLDSSAIGLIIGRYKLVNAMGGRVAVTGLSPTMDRIFHAAGLYQLVLKYDTAEDASKAM